MQGAEGTEQLVGLGGRGAGQVGALHAESRQQDLGDGPWAGGKRTCGHLCPWGTAGLRARCLPPVPTPTLLT